MFKMQWCRLKCGRFWNVQKMRRFGNTAELNNLRVTNKKNLIGEKMNKKLIATLGILVCLLAIPTVVWADTQTFHPPAEKGYIWVIIQHKKSFPPMDTKVSIKWGKWSKEASFSAARFRYSYEGVVIRLTHSKDDSVPLTVSTDGTIVNIYQGDKPSQSGSKTWDSKNW